MKNERLSDFAGILITMCMKWIHHTIYWCLLTHFVPVSPTTHLVVYHSPVTLCPHNAYIEPLNMHLTEYNEEKDV